MFKIILLLSFAALFVGGMMSSYREGQANPTVVPPVEPDLSYLEPAPEADTDPIICEELPILAEEDVPEYEVPRSRKVEEVVTLWELYFDDENAPKTDPRREHFYEWAELLMDSVEMYQQNPTDIGGQFPDHKNDHLVMAYTAAKESSVTPDVKSKSEHGEVCFMQLHGQALAGYSPEKVQHNPRLCFLLGARWLASRIPACDQYDNRLLFVEEWGDWDWVGPLSFYAGGPRALKKGGGCKSFDTMKARVTKVLFYRMRVDSELEKMYD